MLNILIRNLVWCIWTCWKKTS